MNSEFSIGQGAGHKLELAGRRNDWQPEDIEWLSTGDNGRAVTLLRTGKAKLIEVAETGSQGAVIPSAPIMLVVDYTQTLKQMILAGRYDDRENDDITAKHFPIKGNGTVEFEVVLFHFDRSISSENAKKQIEKAGYEVGRIEHLLSFGANYPEEQRKFPIIALGSVAHEGDDRRVPFLVGGAAKRYLRLASWVGDWSFCDRFLAVRKKS